MHVEINEFIPCKPLQPFIAQFWQGSFNLGQGDLLRQRVVPNGFVELVIHLSDNHCDLPQGDGWLRSPDYTLIGMQMQAYEVQFSDLVPVFGIRFKPEGFLKIFGIPAAEFGDTSQDMSQVAGKEFNDYCARLKTAAGLPEMLRLSENYLLKNLEKTRANLDYLSYAAELIRKTKGFIRIDELANRIFISTRQLERRFKETFGITPKQYIRLARLNEAYRRLQLPESPDLTGLSYDCGYSDQSHFIRDFRAFTGEKPTAFVKNRDKYIVNVEGI